MPPGQDNTDHDPGRLFARPSFQPVCYGWYLTHCSGAVGCGRWLRPDALDETLDDFTTNLPPRKKYQELDVSGDV